MEFIDTHTHIYIDKFEVDFDEMMSRAANNQISTFVLPAIDSGHTEAMMSCESENVHLMMGLHPCSVGSNVGEELDYVRQWLEKRSFCAIGEIGIDLYWDKTFQAEQVGAFELQIDWAIEFNLPIVIHSRNSTSEVLEVLKRKAHPQLRGIFHCFGGSVEEANAIIDLGFLLGIGGVVTFKNAGLDKTLEHISLRNIVLETDAPYLAPAPFRGKRNEPSYIKIIAEKVAEIKNVDLEEVADRTTNNARLVFGL
ncbi:MAG: TatD family hydrolase [Bacteroidia bacterium]|nr:TatD family hydrolase [Bacteroidia bacterium]